MSMKTEQSLTQTLISKSDAEADLRCTLLINTCFLITELLVFRGLLCNHQLEDIFAIMPQLHSQMAACNHQSIVVILLLCVLL